MLIFLLDEHVSSEVARQIASKRPEIGVVALLEWEGGVYCGIDERLWLSAAYEQRLTLVTYDRRTIQPLLTLLGDRQETHGGVILVDNRSIAQSNIGGLVNTLIQLWDLAANDDWTDRVMYLRAAESS